MATAFKAYYAMVLMLRMRTDIMERKIDALRAGRAREQNV
jgi:hypothetical protein